MKPGPGAEVVDVDVEEIKEEGEDGEPSGEGDASQEKTATLQKIEDFLVSKWFHLSYQILTLKGIV